MSAQMSLTYSAHLVPSRSCRSLDTGSGLPPVAIEFDHSNTVDGGFFAENEKTFLSVVSASAGSELSQEDNQARETKNTPPTRLEQLPNELFQSVIERLDISSLINVASANKNIRYWVQALSDVKKTQRSIYSARAVSRMYTMGTAKKISLRQFIQAFESPSCGLCKSTTFAVSFCMMECCRVCDICQRSGPLYYFLPVEMTAECFGLDSGDVICSKGLARVPIPSRTGLAGYYGRFGKPITYSHVDVISLKSALEIAINKYYGYGGMLYVKHLANEYLMKQNIDLLRSDPHETVFLGFTEAARRYWKALGVDRHTLKRLLLTSLPYLKPKTYPLKTESGIHCQGCIRKYMYRPGILWTEPALWLNDTIYLEDTFPAHLKSCSAAQSIIHDMFLSFQNEFELFKRLLERKCSYWPKKDKAPEEVERLTRIWPGRASRQAKSFRAWYTKCMARIIESGERQLKYKRLRAEIQRIHDAEGSISDPPSNTNQAEQSPKLLQRDSSDTEGPRRESMMSQSGRNLITDTYSGAANSIVLQSHSAQETRNDLAQVQSIRFAEGLKRLGVSHEKALVQGLWEMRTADEDSCSSSEAEIEEGEDDEDSEEEL